MKLCHPLCWRRKCDGTIMSTIVMCTSNTFKQVSNPTATSHGNCHPSSQQQLHIVLKIAIAIHSCAQNCTMRRKVEKNCDFAAKLPIVLPCGRFSRKVHRMLWTQCNRNVNMDCDHPKVPQGKIGVGILRTMWNSMKRHSLDFLTDFLWNA